MEYLHHASFDAGVWHRGVSAAARHPVHRTVVPVESEISAAALQSPSCGGDDVCAGTGSRGLGRGDVSRGQRHESDPEHFRFESDRQVRRVANSDEFVDAGAVAEIPENRARIVCLSGERVAIFKYDGKISAVSNVCQHQNGPLGEGRIIYGRITCPWHGYQYQPDTGASPPPFVEKVPTFIVRVKNGRVLVDPKPNPAGTKIEPALIQG